MLKRFYDYFSLDRLLNIVNVDFLSDIQFAMIGFFEEDQDYKFLCEIPTFVLGFRVRINILNLKNIDIPDLIFYFDDPFDLGFPKKRRL